MIIDIPTVEGGEFIDGGPNTLGTIVTAAFLNAVMRSSTSTTKEIQTVLIKAGINPNDTAFDQLYKAIDFMITSQLDAQPISNGYSATRQYRSGELVFVDGIWYEAYSPDGCKGKDPRDNSNRPSGWLNTDIHAPYYWIEVGKCLMLPEIGSPIYLMTMNMREGLIKLRNDAQLSAKKFWRIAELNPNLVKNGLIELADLRANVIRSLDDGKGVDVGRMINSYQEDTTQKVVGTFPITGFDSAIAVSVTGPFSTEERGTTSAGGNYYGAYKGTFDNSKVARTANENRMKNIAMLCTIRI